MYFTSRSHPEGREIVDMISGQTVAVYKTGNLESRTVAEEQAREARIDLLNSLAKANLIINDGRVLPLPTLQQAFRQYQAL